MGCGAVVAAAADVPGTPYAREPLETVSFLRDMFMSRLIHARDLNTKSRKTE